MVGEGRDMLTTTQIVSKYTTIVEIVYISIVRVNNDKTTCLVNKQASIFLKD